ncbi:hypothetical protein Tco_0879133 [Tanacetum coccineum]
MATGSSTSHTVCPKASAMKDDTYVLSIFDDDEDNHLNVDLLDLYDHCYARQAVVDNAVNRRSYELLDVIEKLRGEADNPVVSLLREKMSSLAAEAKEQKVISLEAKKANLEATEALLHQEIAEVKHDRREVVSKVVPYACIELLHSDEIGRLVGKLVSSAITFGWCRAYEQVARMKDPFDLSKVKGYRPSYKKEHTQAINDLATTTFSWLDEYVANASTFVEALLSKKPPTLQKPIPLMTQIPVPSSQLATLSSTPSSKPMSPPADIVKPSPLRLSCVDLAALVSLLGTRRSLPQFMGLASTHFVECSTAIAENCRPLGAIGSGPRIWIPQWLKGHALSIAMAPSAPAFLIVDCSFHLSQS